MSVSSPTLRAKRRCVFKDRRADLAEVVAGKDWRGGGLDAVPERRLRRQKIARAAHGFQGLAHSDNLWGNFLGY